jgi:hypothetical protein
MKEFLIFILFIVISAVLWIFATSLTVTGQGGNNSRYAFIAKSMFYWAAVISAFIFGYLMH